MIELNVTQGSPEWHAARAKCFNASEAPAMMGVSAYLSRSELLRQKATGIIPEIDAATQRRFDDGHAAEAAARPLAEKIIGEELYPIVATDDAGRLLASSDGATMLCDIGFEHKLWNENIAEQVRAGEVPDSHKWQLDQQIAIFGFAKILFIVSDGTPENFASCWYSTTPERIAQLKAGWDQFEADLKNYQHVEAKPAAVAEVIEDLPALTVQLVGQVTASNLATFQTVVLERIKAINTDLKTDADFATADKMVKFLDDGEKRLELVKSQALAQTQTIDELFRTIDSLKAEMKQKRITLDKLVKAEKETRKAEIVRGAETTFSEHLAELRTRIGFSFDCRPAPFSQAIHGLKSIDSMRDKVSVALANAKIEANAIADRIDANRKTVEDMSLFPDFASVCTKAPDDFAALLAMRANARKEAEEKRLAAERERIRAEEQAKAQREAAEALARQNVEAAANNQTQFEQPAEEPKATEKAADDAAAAACIAPIVVAELAARREPDAAQVETMKLGEICARIGAGFTVTADFLASLGIHPVGNERAAKLYAANSFPTICRKIQEHLMGVIQKSLGGKAA